LLQYGREYFGRGWMAIKVAVLLCHLAAMVSVTFAQGQVLDSPFSPDQMFEQLFGASTVDEQVALSRIEISPRDEKRFGDAMVDAYLASVRQQGFKVVDRGRDVEYLKELVAIVKPFMTKKDRYRSIKVYVVDSADTDARSFPGGTLVFFRGLLDFAETEAALIGAVGHELSHLDHGHQLLPLRRMKYFERSFKVPGAVTTWPQMQSALRIMGDSVFKPFRPEDETEADRDGATWTFHAGYDPRQFGKLFLKLHSRDGDQPAMFTFLRTHPYRLDRFREIQNLYRTLSEKEPGKSLYEGRKNLGQRIPRRKKTFVEQPSN
jgi:predicted Zn-dependent protease